MPLSPISCLGQVWGDGVVGVLSTSHASRFNADTPNNRASGIVYPRSLEKSSFQEIFKPEQDFWVARPVV
jgi:hypothetical protein